MAQLLITWRRVSPTANGLNPRLRFFKSVKGAPRSLSEIFVEPFQAKRDWQILPRLWWKLCRCRHPAFYKAFWDDLDVVRYLRLEMQVQTSWQLLERPLQTPLDMKANLMELAIFSHCSKWLAGISQSRIPVMNSNSALRAETQLSTASLERVGHVASHSSPVFVCSVAPNPCDLVSVAQPYWFLHPKLAQKSKYWFRMTQGHVFSISPDWQL